MCYLGRETKYTSQGCRRDVLSAKDIATYNSDRSLKHLFKIFDLHKGGPWFDSRYPYKSILIVMANMFITIAIVIAIVLSLSLLSAIIFKPRKTKSNQKNYKR